LREKVKETKTKKSKRTKEQEGIQFWIKDWIISVKDVDQSTQLITRTFEA